MPTNDVTLKTCRGCRQSLPLVCFWRDASRRDGKFTLCKNCASIKMSAYWKQVYYPRRRVELIERVLRRKRERREAQNIEK
jgi:hypothetical protein